VTPQLLSGIRAVVFDAVGTLIHPEPPAGIVYAEAGRRFGSSRTEVEIAVRFTTAFRRQEDVDYASGLRTDEAREIARWQAIVAEVLDDVAEPDACFRYLYEHFARPAAWRMDASAAATLAGLAERGYRLGIASNFDSRLHEVLKSGVMSALPLVISAAVGWRKPAAAFYTAICQAVGAQPHEVLYVGDDRRNDYDGARNAGLSAVLFDPRSRVTENVRNITRLSELLEI
jgi:putative hydrolase of the HAD superfamily